MSVVHKENGIKIYPILADDKSAEAQIIPELGAAVSSLRLSWDGKLHETLFLHPFFWDKVTERTRGGFPFIFPICGRLERDTKTGVYNHDGRQYKMPNHGFSMRLPWNIVDCSKKDSLILSLTDNESTRSQYPFSFRLTLTFKVADSTFSIEQEYQNTGAEPMPYYAGFHPYFLTPDPGKGKENVTIDYRPVEQWTYNEKLTDIIKREAPPSIPCPITDPGINEKLTLTGKDNIVRLKYPDDRILHISANGVEDNDMFRFVQLYTIPDKPFFCVEHWMSFPNALNSAKGCRWLNPGKTEHGMIKVSSSNK